MQRNSLQSRTGQARRLLFCSMQAFRPMHGIRVQRITLADKLHESCMQKAHRQMTQSKPPLSLSLSLFLFYRSFSSPLSSRPLSLKGARQCRPMQGQHGACPASLSLSPSLSLSLSPLHSPSPSRSLKSARRGKPRYGQARQAKPVLSKAG